MKKKKALKVYYQLDDESTPEEREARLTRAFRLIFSEYEKYLLKKETAKRNEH